jgi:hypothetical protein
LKGYHLLALLSNLERRSGTSLCRKASKIPVIPMVNVVDVEERGS